MKSILMSLATALAALFLVQFSPAAAPKAGAGQLADVEVNGKNVGTVRLAQNGLTNLNKLASGHKVSVQLKNGQAVLAKAVNARGISLPATVQNDTQLAEDPCAGGHLTKNKTAARRTIIIVIRDGGTVIVIVIRTRLA